MSSAFASDGSPSAGSSQAQADSLNLAPHRLHLLGEIIGRGGFSVVRLARLRPEEGASGEEGVLVACKMVTLGDSDNDAGADSSSTFQTHQSTSSREESLQRLVHEQTILRALDHPGIVRLLGCVRTSTHACSLLSLAPYGDLSLHLRHHARRGLPRSTVRSYFTELVAIVSFLHSRGVRHRDISSRNLLIDQRGHIVLTDFGLAVKVKDSDQPAQADEASSKPVSSLSPPVRADAGTVHYLAPERLKADSPYADTFASDWWSCGVALFEMIFGVLPFDGSLLEVRDQLLRYDGVVPLRPFPPLNDELTLDLMRRLLHPDPAQRLGSSVSSSVASALISPLRSDPAAVQSHSYFAGVDWSAIDARWSEPGPPSAEELSLLRDLPEE